MALARWLGVALLVGWAALSVGDAASITLGQARIGASWTSVDRCTTTGLGVVHALSGTNIVSVLVSGVPSSCGGASLLVTVNNGSTTASGTATVPTGGGNVVVALSVATATATRVQTDFVLVGP